MIIGLTGKAGSGKDTAVLGLENYFPMAFATPIKDSAKILYDLTDEQLHGKLKEVVDPRWNKSPRQIMQELGDHCRKDCPRFFVILMRSRIEKAKKQGIKDIVLTDIRYDVEAQMVKDLEGKIMLIDREGFTSTKHTDHSSEAGILSKYIDYTMVNNGSIEELVQKVKKIGLYGKA